MSPLFTIVIPTRNRATLLRETLDSLRSQTLGAFEALVVDDHSTDPTDLLVGEVARVDRRFKLLPQPDGTEGAPAARNLGARLAGGRFVIFLDSDDLLAPDCLERRARAMGDQPDLDFVVSPCACFKDKPGDTALRWNVDTDENDLDRLLKGDVPWQTTGPTWRREALAKILPWDEAALGGQDWEFHIRALLAKLKYTRLADIDFFWRMPDVQRGSISASSFEKRRVQARPALVGRVLDAVRRAGELTEPRKLVFAGLYWQAARLTAEKVSRAESRAVWRIARDQQLIDTRRWREGWLYLASWKIPAVQRRLGERLERRWPDELLARRSPTFLKAPLDPDTPPRVSVLMSVYNGEPYLARAIESILRQTFRDFELIVVDDGSTDRSLQILRRFARSDARLRIISRPNTGLTRALNEGLSHCRGVYVARMDGDDWALPERFARQVEYLDTHPDCVVVGSRVLYVNPRDLPVSGDAATSTSDHPTDHASIDARLLEGKGGSIVHPSAMFRRDAMLKVGGYREQFNNSEDLDLFLRLAEVGQLANLPEVLLHYRRHLESVSHQKYENQWKLKTQIVREAYQRRGLSFPDNWTFTPWKPKPHAEQLREWGWMALRTRHKSDARHFAWNALKLAPTRVDSWKLLACAIRGR